MEGTRQEDIYVIKEAFLAWRWLFLKAFPSRAAKRNGLHGEIRRWTIATDLSADLHSFHGYVNVLSLIL